MRNEERRRRRRRKRGRHNIITQRAKDGKLCC
jgi:hypothetical protein